MKIKQAMRYQLNEMARPTLYYYIAIAGISIITLLLGWLITGAFSSGSMNTDSASVIFIFVIGLNVFKNPFKVFLQNGISRRTQFTSTAIVALGMAVVISLINSVFPFLMSKLRYVSTFSSLYSGSNGTYSFVSLLWNIAIHYAAFAFGYFLTTLYYRMNKGLKVAVSIGVPLLLFVVLPMLELFYPSFNLFTSLLKFAAWALGIDLATGRFLPMRAVASFGVFSLIALCFTFLLMRRATLKES